MFQCKDIFSLVSMAQVEILAGKKGLNRGIRWSYKAENINFEKWVHGDELLIVSSPITQRKKFDLFQIINKAIELNMSCALLMMGNNYVEEVEEKVIELAEKNNFPLFAVPWDVPLLDFFEELGHAISYLDDRKNIQDNLLAEIIFGGSVNIHNLEHKCAEMGFGLDVLEQIFIIHLDKMNNDEIRSYARTIQDLFQYKNYSAIVSCYGDRIIGFMKDISNQKELIVDIFTNFEKQLYEEHPGIEYALNISEKCDSIENLKKCFDMTSKINGILKHINRSNEIVFYEQMGIYRLLMSYNDEAPMYKFIDDVIGEIIEYDDKNHTQLVVTLWSYFSNDCNLQKTADSLFAHKNTIKYRLQRASEILKRDLGNSFQSFEIYNALIMYYFLN